MLVRGGKHPGLGTERHGLPCRVRLKSGRIRRSQEDGLRDEKLRKRRRKRLGLNRGNQR